jgi:hypothetical protein
MKSNELSKQVREKYRSGLGYKKISETFNIPRSIIKSIIKQWKEYGTTANLPRNGHPPKMKKMQISTVEVGVSFHRITLSCTVHRAGLYGRVSRKEPFKEKNKQTRLVFTKRHVGDSSNI